uniref:Uncharacterized protein n=1 Tax=uncultured Thiotrichaceae bacterium TaxID=298394 RepID=A0A6S6UBP8_9GAMM|nr:MAG: Unknown protein [uncultured Thiotrichaceae bacterium]
MNNKIKIHLVPSLLFIVFYLSNAAFAKTPDFQTATHLPLTQLPESDPSKTGSYYNRGYAFSHDSRLFALFQSGKEISESQYTGSTLQIWDTQTGQLKYKTTLPQHEDSYRLRATPIAFSHDDKVLFRSGGRQADMFVWPFTQSDKATLPCLLGNLNDIQNVVGVSKDKQQFLVSGIEYESVCRLDGNKLDYQKINTHRLWGDNTKILHNNRLLLIHNIRSTKNPTTDAGHSLSKEELDYINFWDVNFSSDADFLLQTVNQEGGRFFITEVFENQVIINQWDYTKQAWIGKQSFKDIQLAPKEKSQLNTYFSNDYLLIQSKNELTLFQYENDQFLLVWHKKISEPTDAKSSLVNFSSDSKYIILGDLSFNSSSHVTLISTQTGDIFNQYEARQNASNAIITEPLINNFPNQPLESNCPETAKTSLHNLVSNQSQKINGHVLAMSGNGKVLAVCKSEELFLLKIEHQKE